MATLSSRFQVLGIDLQGVFHMSKACLPHLKKSGQATGDSIIINITATLMNTATPFQMHAASAKAGINVLTQVMLVAVGPARSALSAALHTVVRALPPHELLACACTEYGAGVGGVRHSRGGHRAGADRRHCRRAWWPCLRPRSDPMPAICVTARMVPSSTGQSLCACRDVEYPE